jgi:uncharacterized membrane protein
LDLALVRHFAGLPGISRSHGGSPMTAASGFVYGFTHLRLEASMVDRLLFPLTLVSALGCGLMAGVFFAFSVFVMHALDRLPPAQGIAAMQSVNVAAITPLFMLALFGTAATCVVLAVSSLLRWKEPGAVYLFVGSVLYLVGAMLVTIVFNVPRNDALAAVAPESADGASLWIGYVTSWTAWNHVRTVAALAATVSFMIALRR